MSVATGIARRTFTFSKSVTLIFGAYLLVFLAVIASFALSVVFSGIVGSFTMERLSVFHLFLTLLLTPLKILPLMFLGLFLGVLTRSAIFPIASLISYTTLGEPLLTLALPNSSPRALYHFLPGQISNAIDIITIFKIDLILNAAKVERIARTTAEYGMTQWISIYGVLAYTVVFGLLSYTVFRKQDLSR